MIQLLTDDVVIGAADRGSRRFLNRYPHGTMWIGDLQDVFQEGRLLALAFLHRYGHPSHLNPGLISCRVYYDLIDLVRSRSKCRTLNPVPFFADVDVNVFGTGDQTQNAAEIRDVLATLSELLTFKEAVALDLFKRGFSQAQIARELGIARSCVAKRFCNIRCKLAVVLCGKQV